MTSFSIVILNWNGLTHLQECLQSVHETNYPSMEIILADNGSTDESLAWVKQHFPDISILELKKNYFFAGGNNRAIKHCKNDYVIFLNNDVKVDPMWLHSLHTCIVTNPKSQLFQPKILSAKKPTHFEYAGAAGGFIDRYGYPYCRGRIFDLVEEDTGQYDTDESIDWASGAAMVIKKTLFEELQGFDEDFEMHMEEIDLCWRARDIGHTITYCHNAKVYHIGGGSLAQGSYRKIWYNFRNNWYMLIKNLPKHRLFRVLFIRYLLDVIALKRALLTGKFSEAKAIFSAHLSLVKEMPNLLHKRSLNTPIHSKMTTGVLGTNTALIRPFLVWEFFFNKNKTFSEIQERQVKVND